MDNHSYKRMVQLIIYHGHFSTKEKQYVLIAIQKLNCWKNIFHDLKFNIIK